MLILFAGIWIHAATEHTVQSRFHPLQDTNTPRQAKVLQIYLNIGATSFLLTSTELTGYYNLRGHSDESAPERIPTDVCRILTTPNAVSTF